MESLSKKYFLIFLNPGSELEIFSDTLEVFVCHSFISFWDWPASLEEFGSAEICGRTAIPAKTWLPWEMKLPILTEDGHTFRDLNKNGKLDPYEDSRLPIEERVEDLLTPDDPGRKSRADVPYHDLDEQ